MNFKSAYSQLLATVLGTLMAFTDGMVYGWTSPMIPYLLSKESHIPLNTMFEAEMLETICLLGGFAGLPGTILAVDKIGRKKSMILSAVIGCLGWITTWLSPNKGLLYTARFFSGMAGDMCFVAAPMYIAEIADHKIRGFLSSLIYLMMILGILTVYVTGSFCAYWVPPCIGMVLSAIQFSFFPLMPESPYYLVYTNRMEEAKISLKWLRNDEDINQELNEIQTAVARQKTEKGRIQDLIMIRSNRIALAIMTILNGVQHFAGISVLIMNLHVILSEAGSIYIEPSLAAIIFAVIILIGATTASVFIDKFGRKVLLITSSLLTGITLLVMTIFFHLKNLGYNVALVSWIPAVCCMTYAATFKLGLGLVPIVVTAEIFPNTIKSIGMSSANTIYVVMAIISIQIYSVLFDNYGIHVPFYIFTVCCFLMAVVTQKFIPETKGKTLDEIQMMLTGLKPEPHKISTYENEEKDLLAKENTHS